MFKIHDKMYDLTEFKSVHPGGDDIFNHLQENTDITPIIYSYHVGIPRILKTLVPYERNIINHKNRFVTNFNYDNYCELKTLVYNELRDKNIPKYWSSGELFYNLCMSILLFSLWGYCIYYSVVSTITAVPIILLSCMTVGHGLLVFHECCHYSAFKNPYLNTIASKLFLIPFCSEHVWKYEHNYLHHSFTNTQHDIDIEGLVPYLCQSQRHSKYWFHSFQCIYIFIFCLLGSISKGLLNGILNNQYQIPIYNLVLFYIFGAKHFCLMHATIGFLFAFIAQLSHIQPECNERNKENDKNDYLYNQVSSSVNYKTDNIFSRFICFGLDIQIEHHLFPNLPHSSLRRIRHIVKKYCTENNIPYIEKQSMSSAVYSYVTYLYDMGNKNSLDVSIKNKVN